MSRSRILLVDDDIVFVKAITQRLWSEGFDVMTAFGGTEAVSAMRYGKPDLLLLDIVFPFDGSNGDGVPMDGFAILDWVRQMGGLTDVPVVMMTAADPEPYVERARMAGASALISKTAPSDMVIHHIRRLIGEKAAEVGEAQQEIG